MERSGRLSPSAFIPFCQLGGDASLLGRRAAGFDVPVCDKFEARVVEGQICYRLDSEHLRRSGWKGKEGLTLLLDYNEERNIQQPTEPTQQGREESFESGIVELQHRDKARIILETISQ